MRNQGFLALILALFLAVEASLAAQPESDPPQGAGGGLGGEFVPSAGYLQTLKLLRYRRELETIGAAMAPGLDLSLSGRRSIPVLCVEFPNRPHTFDVEGYQTMLFGDPNSTSNTPQQTLTQYYRDNSNNRFVPTGTVSGWYRLPENDNYYELNNHGLNERLGELLQFTLNEADATTDFSVFDNDGPDGIPNTSDDDGLVDTLFIVHSETGGECDRSTGNLWSHSFQYSQFQNHNGPFTTNDVRRDDLGQPILNADGTPAMIQIEDYTVQPGLACPRPGETAARMIPIGVFCHEYGHALGLPDLYDRTPKGAPDSEGVGNYCLMAGGAYGADGKHAETPVNLSAWCKAILGWGNLQKIAANTALAFEPVQGRNRIYAIDVAGTDGQEFFLLEYRDSTWADPFGEKINWDRGYNPGGLAIWHVDERVGNASPNWPFAPNDQGQNDAPSLPGFPLPSFRTPHSLVSLIQSDGDLHLERKQNRGDTFDLFLSGHSFEDDEECKAGSRTYSGQPSGISVSDINLAMRTANVRLDAFPDGAEPLAIASLQAPAGNTAPRLPAPAVSESDIPRLRQLHDIELKGTASGWQMLSTEDREFIKQTPVNVIKQGISAPNQTEILKISVEERTSKNTEIDPTASPFGKALHDFIDEGTAPAQTDVLFAAEGDRIESITGLAVPIEGKSPWQDSVDRIDSQLKVLFGEEFEFDTPPQPENEAAPIRFHQVATVDGTKIPLSCNGITLYYQEDELRAVKSNLVSLGEKTITGTPDSLSVEEAQAIVAQQLKVPSGLIGESSSCIYFDERNPNEGRVSVRVSIDSGNERRHLNAFVDAETKSVLNVDYGYQN